MFSNYSYKKLTWLEIDSKLESKNERTEFTENATDGMKFDQVEDACYAIDINIDVDLAYEAIQQKKDLTNVLEAAQVEFCCG